MQFGSIWEIENQIWAKARENDFVVSNKETKKKNHAQTNKREPSILLIYWLN